MAGTAGARGAGSPAPDGDTPVWTPGSAQIRDAEMTAFIRFAREQGASGVLDYPSLYRWSIEHPEQVWPAVWKCRNVVCTERAHGDPWDEVVVGLDRMAPPDPDLGPRWFTGARLNFAENLLRHRGPEAAVTAWNEKGRYRSLSFDELRAEVARVARSLRSMGVVAGDRVAGFLPNVPEAVIAMLATASISIWARSPAPRPSAMKTRQAEVKPKSA